MNNLIKLVVFTLDKNRYALPLASVEKVIPVVEITPLPKAPDIVIGVINMQGRIIPVVDVRKRFCLPEKEITLSDKIILLQTTRRSVGIIADTVSGVITCSEQEVTEANKILPGLEYVEGVVKLKEGMLLIHDIDRFLSIEEEKMLDKQLC